jgi:tetratricopeptide (TPR) repeat protein
MKEEKKWLVKSSDSILGPYIFDDVVTHIFNGEIHLLDEIKGPFERWRPIKDHSLFAAAIEKLKASTYQNRENTVTATVDINTKTQEMTKSQTVSLTNKDNSSITPTSETVIYQPESIPVDPHSAPLPNQPPPPQAQPGNRFPTAFLVSFLLIVFGGASYLVYEFKQTRLIEQKISLYDQLTDVAIDSLKVGEYQKALNNFKRAYNISPQDPNLVAEMAPLSVQFDGQFDQTQALLENLMATTNEKSIIKIAHNAIGLSHSYRENFEKALESYDVSLDIDPNYLPSLLNKAFAFLKLEQHLEAVGLMRKVVSDYPDEPIAHYLYIRSLAELGMAKKDEKALKEALSVSDQFSRKFSDFKQEVLFLIAVVNSYLEVKPAQPEQLVDQFLRVDPELTRLHVHDPNVDFQSFNWFDFISHCERLEQGLSDYKAQVLQAFCALKVNNPIDAKRKLEQWLSEGSNDGLLQSLYSSALLALGNVSQAKNALGYINEVDPKQPVVETILRGCLRAGDLSCGEAIFRGQHAQHISLLYSHWGNSEVNFAKDRGKAKSSVVLGLSISPHFSPLLKIQRRMTK